MKPHLEHIAQTLERKDAAERAKDPVTTRERYLEKIEKAKAAGYTIPAIINALEYEIERIKADHRPGDPLFLHGVNNSKIACISSISVLIEELKGHLTHGGE